MDPELRAELENYKVYAKWATEMKYEVATFSVWSSIMQWAEE